MRRLAVYLAALFPLTQAAAAAQTLLVGAHAGVSSARLDTPDDYYGRHFGYVVGAAATLELADWLALQAGALLHQKGSAGPDAFIMRIAYLETPVLLRLRFGGSTSPVRPFLSAGVAPARELSCGGQQLGFTLSGAPPPQPGPIDCNGYRTDRWDLGLVLGGGFQVRVGRPLVSVSARYTSGTHNIASGYPDGFPVNNRALSFLIGADIPILRRRPSNMRLKLPVRALYIGAHPLRRAPRAARSLSATR